MTLNYVELTLDLYDGQGNAVTTGTATLTPTTVPDRHHRPSAGRA